MATDGLGLRWIKLLKNLSYRRFGFAAGCEKVELKLE